MTDKKIIEFERDGIAEQVLVNGACCPGVYIELKPHAISWGDFTIVERHSEDCPELINAVMAYFTNEVEPQPTEEQPTQEEATAAPEPEATG